MIIHHQNHHRNDNIRHPHNGYQQAGSFFNGLGTAQYADSYQGCHNSPNNGRGYRRIIKAVDGKGGLHIVGAQKVEPKGIGQQQENNEGSCQSLIVQGIFNVVGRAPVGGTVLFPPLEDLG